MRWYSYEDMSPTGFENLVIAVCQHLLGHGVIGFAPGPDGGRDAKFHGTAALHPSPNAPWTGKTIVQAKHTNGYNRYFTDSDFYSTGNALSTLAVESIRVKSLLDTNNLNNYMLFANRILSGNGESAIRTYLSNETGVPEERLYLCGRDQLDMHLKTWPNIARIGDIAALQAPLKVDANDLAEIIESLHSEMPAAGQAMDDPPVDRVSFEDKNVINNMSPKYAKDRRKRYLSDCFRIEEFLGNPENIVLQRLYETVVDEFQGRILSKRHHYESFDDVMEYLVDFVLSRNPVLRSHKRLTRVVLFYMYWHCDIGEVSDA